MILNLKSKHIIKGAIAQIEKKQGKITCVSDPLKDPNIKKPKLNQSKRIKYVFSTTSDIKFVTIKRPS